MTCEVCGEPIRPGGPAFLVQGGVTRCESCVQHLTAVRSVAQAAIAAVRQPPAARPTRATGSLYSSLSRPGARGER